MYVIKSGVLYEANNGVLKEFHSPFAEDFNEQENRSFESESWKHKKGDGDADMSLIPRNMIWGGRGQGRPPAQVKFNAVYAVADRLYYVLEMSTSCGLFYYDFTTEQETRLFHRTEFKPCGLFIGDDYGILTTAASTDGPVHLVQYEADGKRERVLTSGDCRDENPARHGSDIYYQSCGLARNAAGQVMAAGPSAIHKLDTKTGDIETILSSDKFDYLLPRAAADGALYCIQTPHQAGPAYPIKNRLLDILLFPWRMCVAIFAFLNVFSILFAKKPLTTAGGPNPKHMEVSARVLHNRVVNLQDTWRKEGKKVAVSKQWKLVKWSGGQITEIASNVLWFDLDAEDRPVYTDGYALYDNGGKRQLEADDLISCVTVSGERASAIKK